MRFAPGATLVLALLACVLGGSQAGAHSGRSGVGNRFRYAATVEHMRLLEPLSLRGPDAIRVTVDHLGEMGRWGWTVELHPAGPDRRVPLSHAEGGAATYVATERPVYVAGWEHLSLSRNEYDQIAARVDAGVGSPRPVAAVARHRRRVWRATHSGRATQTRKDELVGRGVW